MEGLTALSRERLATKWLVVLDTHLTVSEADLAISSASS